MFDCAGVTGSWGTWVKSQGPDALPPRKVNLTSTFNIAMQAAIHGAGISMSHDTLARDLLENGGLIRPFDHCPELSESYFLQPAPEHGSTPATRAFHEWIEAEMARFQAG